MSIRKIFFIIIVITCLTSCYWYTERDREYLSITFNDNKLNPYFLEKYIDSVRNRNLSIPDSINYIFFKGDTIYENERFIHFKSDPEEWYIIAFDASPCWIVYVYNKKISDESINSRSVLGDKQIKRIEERFRDEVLKPAEQYGKQHHLPDSVLYNTKFE